MLELLVLFLWLSVVMSLWIDGIPLDTVNRVLEVVVFLWVVSLSVVMFLWIDSMSEVVMGL